MEQKVLFAIVAIPHPPRRRIVQEELVRGLRPAPQRAPEEHVPASSSSSASRVLPKGVSSPRPRRPRRPRPAALLGLVHGGEVQVQLVLHFQTLDGFASNLPRNFVSIFSLGRPTTQGAFLRPHERLGGMWLSAPGITPGSKDGRERNFPLL